MAKAKKEDTREEDSAKKRSGEPKTASAKRSGPRFAGASAEASESKEETYKVRGEKLLEKVKELVKEGNVRRIIIKDKKGKTMVEFPMTFGVVGVLIAPTLAAIGALAALITECSITVEREV